MLATLAMDYDIRERGENNSLSIKDKSETIEVWYLEYEEN